MKWDSKTQNWRLTEKHFLGPDGSFYIKNKLQSFLVLQNNIWPMQNCSHENAETFYKFPPYVLLMFLSFSQTYIWACMQLSINVFPFLLFFLYEKSWNFAFTILWRNPLVITHSMKNVLEIKISGKASNIKQKHSGITTFMWIQVKVLLI